MIENTKKDHYVARSLAALAVLGALFVGVARSQSDKPVEPIAPIAAKQPNCNSDWRLCRDNTDLIDSTNVKVTKAQVECEMEANKQSQYGDGTWSWTPFGTYRAGDDYVKTGVLLLKDRQVSFPNGFGAQVRSSVLCKYDLNTETVRRVIIMGQGE